MGRTRPKPRSRGRRRAGTTKLERMRLHVRESLIDRGLPYEVADRIACAKVNKHRAALSRGKTTCRTKRGRTTCRTLRGPRLVREGGSRRQWYPGKKLRRERHRCLRHERTFKTKAALKSHLRSRSHGRRSRSRAGKRGRR